PAGRARRRVPGDARGAPSRRPAPARGGRRLARRSRSRGGGAAHPRRAGARAPEARRDQQVGRRGPAGARSAQGTLRRRRGVCPRGRRSRRAQGPAGTRAAAQGGRHGVTDLRSFLQLLEERGELVRVKDPVSTFLEAAALADRAVKEGGPALLFENVVGHSIPVAMNLYGTAQRTAWALGVDDLKEVTERLRELLDLRLGGGLMGMMSN